MKMHLQEHSLPFEEQMKSTKFCVRYTIDVKMGSGQSVVSTLQNQVDAKSNVQFRTRASFMCLSSLLSDAACMPLHGIYGFGEN